PLASGRVEGGSGERLALRGADAVERAAAGVIRLAPRRARTANVRWRRPVGRSTLGRSTWCRRVPILLSDRDSRFGRARSASPGERSASPERGARMPVEPAIAAILEQVNALPALPLRSTDPEVLREAERKL